MPQLIETKNLSARDRFAFWQDMVGQVAMPVAAHSRYADNFLATIQIANFGVMEAIRLKHRPLDIYRSPALIRRSDPEVYHLVLNLAGHQQFAQQRNETVLRQGDMMLYHSSHVFQTRTDPRISRESAIVLTIPPNLLPFPAARLKTLLAVRLSSSDPLGKLVSVYLRTLTANAQPFDLADADRLSLVTVDLISIMLARYLDAEASVPPDNRGRAMFARIQSYVHQHVGDPALSPTAIAAAHHISVRTLHRLFHANGMTTAGLIRTIRLERCRRDLIDPRMSAMSVRRTAERCGFPDNAHFSRLFKDRYGMSPQAYRRAGVRAA